LQCVLLVVCIAALFVAVSFELEVAAWLGVGLAVLSVLAGIAIDVNGPSSPNTMKADGTPFDSYATQVRR